MGAVRHVIAPNWIDDAYVADWMGADPEAQSWAGRGVAKRAAKRGLSVRFDHALTSGQGTPWKSEIGQMVVPGSRIHREAVFFHHASATLILTDLIENFEPSKLPWWMAAITRLAGIAAPNGRMPPDMKATFNKPKLAAAVRQLIDWGPERVILSHGAWYDRDGANVLRRAFGHVLANY